MNLGIIGLGRVGQTQARIFNSLGINVQSTISSNFKNALNASNYLYSRYNFKPKPFSNINDFLNSEIDVVSICTPFKNHFEHIISCFDKNLFVFVEKPLFWEDIDKKQLIDKLNKIKNHKNRKIMLNLNNSSIFNDIDSIPKKDDINRLFFEFNTNGDNQYKYILIDLLPHAISILNQLLGIRKIENIFRKINKNSTIIKFEYGATLIEFRFSQSKNIKKKMMIKINENIYTRLQEGSGENYKLKILDELNNKDYQIKDPFITSISKFINLVKSYNLEKKDLFNEAEINFRIMNDLINIDK